MCVRMWVGMIECVLCIYKAKKGKKGQGVKFTILITKPSEIDWGGSHGTPNR